MFHIYEIIAISSNYKLQSENLNKINIIQSNRPRLLHSFLYLDKENEFKKDNMKYNKSLQLIYGRDIANKLLHILEIMIKDLIKLN